jgi:vesicle transport through interaction with t-SNAREs 1
MRCCQLQKTARTSGGAGGRDELLGGDSWGSSGENQRGVLLDSQTTLDRTSARITNTQRIADETEQIGAGVMTELGAQRDTIVRVAHKTQGIDANLSKSKRILNGMSRRVMTNQLTMVIIIIVLFAILAIVVYIKFLKKK